MCQNRATPNSMERADWSNNPPAGRSCSRISKAQHRLCCGRTERGAGIPGPRRPAKPAQGSRPTAPEIRMTNDGNSIGCIPLPWRSYCDGRTDFGIRISSFGLPRVSSFGLRVSCQVLPEFARAHSGIMPEEMAEVKLDRKTQLRGDVLDRQPLVGQKQPGLVHSGALNVLVECPITRFVKQRAQA